ncbi:MAG: type IV toxin-antitoxin system AbiEi family antitoxin [Gracilimonas sp.]|nr:type IV toxin-antitoxin system AbiEi family antitoxin [Gracilimonas sp.]MBO6584763.1 type IV toxin-antitoxin system AbiEi family antitoxin [Gracilimonas sp.]MBO6615966.1 type IV toxin-antitoxin system AbiEi family antitoxin [Gracilimonas sp.]
MNNGNTYEYLSRYLDQLRSRGRYTFTGDDVISEFNLSDEAYQKVIQRLSDKDRISRLRQNFYLIIPPEYASRQTLPLGYFIDDLMKFLERDYYVGLLTAAMYHGAAHQQPQTQFVVSEPPYLRPIKNRQQSIVFCLKKGWNADFVTQQKTDAGYINISNPALTALDLVSYSDRIGGINRAATVLAELVIELKPDTMAKAAEDFSQTTTLQRLGYLFDEVLQETTLADAIYSVLDNRNYYPTQLNPKTDTENQKAPNRWKIIPNMNVEVD